LELIFFFYAMTPRVRQTYVMSEIIILTMRYLKDAPGSVAERIATKIVEESTTLMTYMSARKEEDNVEILNLLIALRYLGPKYRIDQSLLLKVLQLSLKDGHVSVGNVGFGYFQIVACLYYIGDSAQYERLRQAICKFVVTRFEEEEDWENSAELVFLFLDFIRCPHISQGIKLEVSKVCLRRKSSVGLNARALTLVQYVQSQDWFFLWHDDIKLEDVLERKDLRSPY
jgi:hypothetical protein